MTIDGFARKEVLLENLAKGKEDALPYLSGLYEGGVVARSELHKPLKSYLRIKIDEYSKKAETNDEDYYWDKRSNKARKALDALKEGKEVNYGGLNLKPC